MKENQDLLKTTDDRLTTGASHQSVLLQEIIELLKVQPGQTVLDATVNGGGHSEALCHVLGSEGTLIGLDLDEDAIATSRSRLKGCSSRVYLEQESYKNLDTVLTRLGIGKVHAVLFDLGLSSNQLDTPENVQGRGFSFQKDESLIMTFKKNPDEQELTAAEIVNTWEEGNIADVIYGYGEERFARRIAKAITVARDIKPLETTTELANLIKEAVPSWHSKKRIHPATKTFQALRITVNDEIETLRVGLDKGVKRLLKGGRVAVISFHSIEDRVVKTFFAKLKREGKGVIITKKPMVPTREEVIDNPRARSAKLRIFESN